jgi:hypothetical protein
MGIPKQERSAKGYMDLYKWDQLYATDSIAGLAFGGLPKL